MGRIRDVSRSGRHFARELAAGVIPADSGLCHPRRARGQGGAMTSPSAQVRVLELLREAQERGMGEAAHKALEDYKAALVFPLSWQRKAGRALAEEGLDTSLIGEGVEQWVERERADL